MEISKVKDLDIGMSNIEISGEVTYANDPRNVVGETKDTGRHYDFWSQNLTLADETGSISCNITIKNEEAGLFEGDRTTIKGQLIQFENRNGDMQRQIKGHVKRTREEKARENKTEVTGSEKANNVKEEATAVKRGNNDNNKNLMIAREVALKGAIEMITADKIKPERLVAFSENLVKYIYGGPQIIGTEVEDETPADKKEEPSLAKHIVEENKLEVREGHEDDKITDDEDIPGSSYDNPIPRKSKKKISKAEDFIQEAIPE